jgi:spoIIIJ-associated protein
MGETGQPIEVVGTDVESAIATGLARLGVGRDEVEIEVLDEGKRGVFGLGSRETRVRLTPKAKVKPHPPSTAPSELALPPSAEEEPAGAELGEEERETEIARGVLLELLDFMGIDRVRVDVRRAEPATDETGAREEPPWILDVRGPDTNMLIGRRGKTLAALQRITRLIVGRELESRARLVVDVGGFKARREKSLRRLAHQVAEQAVRTGRTVVLEPMPPNERRAIHLALRDHPHVTTQSVGEGDRRKVTVIPQD